MRGQGYRVWTSRMLNQEHIVSETIALVAFGGYGRAVQRHQRGLSDPYAIPLDAGKGTFLFSVIFENNCTRTLFGVILSRPAFDGSLTIKHKPGAKS